MTFVKGSDRYIQGLKVEQEFAQKMANRGSQVRKSTAHEDIMQHIDLHVDNRKVDVKGVKRILGIPRDDLTYIEIQNEHGKGWVYSDHVSHFAFKQVNGSFLLISKADLQSIIKQYYSECTTMTNVLENMVCDPTKYYYRRTTPGYPTLKNEKTILVKTKYIKKYATVIE